MQPETDSARRVAPAPPRRWGRRSVAGLVFLSAGLSAELGTALFDTHLGGLPSVTASRAMSLSGPVAGDQSSGEPQPGDSVAAITPSQPTTGTPEQPPEAPNTDPPPEATNSTFDVAALSDAELASRLVGQWEGEMYGDQQIDNRADGTARLIAQLDFVAALIYGDRLEMQLKWSVRDRVLTHEILSGEPADNVERLARHQGRSRSYRIEALTDHELTLRSIDDETETRIWTRTGDASSQ
jgi:hypothetical protein